MDHFYRYTLADVLPDSTYDVEDPRADPETAWVRVPIEGGRKQGDFILKTIDPVPGSTTLTVSVGDEAGSITMLAYSWEVRNPGGPVIYIPDASSSFTRNYYIEFMDASFGQGSWDRYDFWRNFPDDPWVLLESLRKFELVIWTDSGTASQNLVKATSPEYGNALSQYLHPTDDSDPGRILFISRILTGTGTPFSPAFLQEELGIRTEGAPKTKLLMEPDKQALGQAPHLPTAVSTKTSLDAGIGVVQYVDQEGVISDTEILYKMEDCRCYSSQGRPPLDPIVGIRVPSRATSPSAWLVGISLQFEEFEQTGVYDVLNTIISIEMGVAP